jgi:hypothetical protein
MGIAGKDQHDGHLSAYRYLRHPGLLNPMQVPCETRCAGGMFESSDRDTVTDMENLMNTEAWTTPDAAFMMMLAGSTISHPVELPSGEVLSPTEAQVWADLYDESYQREVR